MIHSNIIFSQELVSEIEKTKNVVDATNQPNLYERLEALQGQLTLCEKALAEYLETKRLAFPRFYFVSSADLLDILSNGNNPPVVSSIYIDMIHSYLTQLEISSVFTVTNILYNKSFNWVMFV